MTLVLDFELLNFNRLGKETSEFKTKKPGGKVEAIKVSLVIPS